MEGNIYDAIERVSGWLLPEVYFDNQAGRDVKAIKEFVAEYKKLKPDWSKVPPEFGWVTVDTSWGVYGHEELPLWDGEWWSAKMTWLADLDIQNGFDSGLLVWERPGRSVENSGKKA